jgi:predicted phosphodiesterase
MMQKMDNSGAAGGQGGKLRSPVTGHRSPREAPGRGCPLTYRYAPASLAREPELVADTLYVAGGLYGNRPALASILELAAAETGRTAVVFNGDFNWFNVDAEGFDSINRAVLEHVALRGNVETELAGNDDAAGCGCGYPDWVSDDEVERSNVIMKRLRDTARAFPSLRERLGLLPMNLVARVGRARVAIVHGDAQSLAGWAFSQEALDDQAQLVGVSRWFDEARADVFASSHTCLPVACALPGGRVLVNNGAAGMPNFRATRHGVITRIGGTRALAAEALYTVHAGDVRVEALPVHYDTALFERGFLRNWPAGSAAYESYHERITRGPNYEAERAIRRHVAPIGAHRPHSLPQENPT